MDGRGGWKRIFVTNGTVRSPWRILLFAVLFLALLIVGAWIVGPGKRGAETLFRQGAVTLAAALISGWVLLAWLDRRSPGALGFGWTPQTPREAGLGFLIGGGSLALIVAVFALAGWLEYRSEPGTAALYAGVLAGDLVLLAVAAASEEALFRGYPFQVLVQAIGPVTATLLSSALFSVAHAANPNVGPLALINIFLAGVLLAAAYLRTRSLWFATAVHLGWNWTMASLLDLPVSGLAFFDAPLYEPVETGPAWVTGGAFGPEGGIGASVAFLLALWATLRLPGLDEPEKMRELRPLVDDRMID